MSRVVGGRVLGRRGRVDNLMIELASNYWSKIGIEDGTDTLMALSVTNM